MTGDLSKPSRRGVARPLGGQSSLRCVWAHAARTVSCARTDDVIPLNLLLSIVAAAILALTSLAAIVLAGLMGSGPLGRRLAAPGGRGPRRESQVSADGEPVSARARVSAVARDQSDWLHPEAADRRRRPSGEELDEILEGTFATRSYNRAVRILALSFILAVLLIIVISQLWSPVRPEILVTLTLAGIVVLVLHELIPGTRHRKLLFAFEASAGIGFLTVLVLLTGRSLSPFFFLFPLLVGGAALSASLRVTALAVAETLVAYSLVGFAAPAGSVEANEIPIRVGLNLVALLLIVYVCIVISRVQRRTREAAIRLSTVDSRLEAGTRQ